MNDLTTLLEAARAEHALSDLHLLSGEPVARIGGRLRRFGSHWDTATILADLERALSDDQRMRLMGRGDVTVRMPGSWGLVRAQYYREQGRTGLAIRFLDESPPKFSALDLPPVIEEFAYAGSGLVLFTGPAHAGKSTLKASLVRSMDERKMDRHVRIVESPIEWVHSPKSIFVSHVSVGIRADAASYPEALSSALRSDVQALVIGELFSDDGTILQAAEAAHKGLALYATMHANSMASALQMIIDAFPTESERRLRQMLASKFVGGVSLRLVPRSDAVGVIAAAEVTVVNDSIRAMIRSGDFTSLSAEHESGALGMQSLEQDLNRLLAQGKISASDARLAAARPDLIVG